MQAVDNVQNFFRKYLNRRIACVFFLGFSSGLPIALCLSSLQIWFKVSGINIKTIGLLSLVGIPYSYKFLWAPLLDKYVPPFLGRRRGWILISQLLLVATIITMSCFSPMQHAGILAMLGVVLAVFSASQDIAFDAYKIDILPEDERGLGAALAVEAYRIAMLVSGAGAMYLADSIGWQKTYFVMGLLMAANILATFFAPNPKQIAIKTKDFFATFKAAGKDLLTRKNIGLLLAIVLLYKLGDAFSHALTTIFLIDENGVNLTQSQAATINKLGATIATVVGMFFAGILMTRISLFKALVTFGVLQALTNLFYMWISIFHPGFAFIGAAVFIENLCGGMGTAAFVVFIMSLCSKEFSATQFALLSSLTLVGRTYVGPVAGYMVHYFGWTKFYFTTFLVALPGVVILFLLKDTINNNAPNLGKSKEQTEQDKATVVDSTS